MESCRFCSLTFNNITSLISHIGNVHKNFYSYKCLFKDCYRSYASFNSLREHIRRKHGNLSKDTLDIDETPQDLCMKNISIETHEKLTDDIYCTNEVLDESYSDVSVPSSSEDCLRENNY